VTQPTRERNAQSENRRQAKARKRFGLMTYAAIAIAVVVFVRAGFVAWDALQPATSDPVHPSQSVPYLGVYEPGSPDSYTNIDGFAHAIGRQPNLVTYYSHWQVPFNVKFATDAERHGAVTLVQIAPQGVSLASIAKGQYDGYLRSYALAVKAFGLPVVLSFGHEMNGYWYSWGHGQTTATVFVNAWRHVVTVFRQAGARNVTWLWTVNIIGPRTPEPNPWWPGSSYVNWVGIDGYYRNPSSGFNSVFAQTIVDVRELTSDPILIAETAAEPYEDQPEKIAELFAGVHTFGLLGFVWFDADDLSISVPGEVQTWRLTSPVALAAFRRDAKAWMKPPKSSALVQLQPSSSSSP
jgi:mannan endo-1,4-beta-mannosidase